MSLEQPTRPFDIDSLPEEVKACILHLEDAHVQALELIAELKARIEEQKTRIEEQKARIEKLEGRVNKNSSNSNKPPSSDSPFKNGQLRKKSKDGKKRKRGGQKGHKGHQQAMLEPTEIVDVGPTVCGCGCDRLDPCEPEPFYTHQEIELPEMPMQVTHFRLFKAKCRECGHLVAASTPPEHRFGYGSRLSALVALLSGPLGLSREAVRDFIRSVYGIPICTGAIQKIVDRTSEAIEPIYTAIAHEAQSAEIAHVDETSWKSSFKLKWLWVMATSRVAYFAVLGKRSAEAFAELIGEWEGILVSDDYIIYRKWVHLRQACLAHLIRRAKWLSERADPEIARFGENMQKELQRLCGFAHERPNKGEWSAFYARFVGCLGKHEARDDDAGVFARRLLAELHCLWLFLEIEGVEPTNNRAERCVRPGVLWRNRSLGTQSAKGERWVERVLSLTQTCRMHDLATYPILVRALSDYYKGQPNDTAWVGQLP